MTKGNSEKERDKIFVNSHIFLEKEKKLERNLKMKLEKFSFVKII